MYHSLVKERPGVERFNKSAKEGGGLSFKYCCI